MRSWELFAKLSRDSEKASRLPHKEEFRVRFPVPLRYSFAIDPGFDDHCIYAVWLRDKVRIFYSMKKALREINKENRDAIQKKTRRH